MDVRGTAYWTAALMTCGLLAMSGAARPVQPGSASPEIAVDLTTGAGLKAVSAQWRYIEANVVEVKGKTKDGREAMTHDISPHAGGVEFDDSAWAVLDPADIHHPIGAGKMSFAWFRINITIPETIEGKATAGKAVLFEVVIDDYAEVWLEGKLPRTLGQCGGSMVKGFNAPNRLLLTEHATAGQVFHIAVFGANAPLSDPPGNYVWLRSAGLRLCADAGACKPD